MSVAKWTEAVGRDDDPTEAQSAGPPREIPEVFARLLDRCGGRAAAGSGLGKLALDYLVIAALSPVLLILFAAIMLAIRLDGPGPFFYGQERVGRSGRPFRMLKFRTMVPDAEKMKLELAHLNELEWPDFKITNDPRITRVGRFLRRTSLDELPQLLNVLKRDMTLVGPRACSVKLEFYERWQLRRLDVTPGIVGPAQIWRRHGNFSEKAELDILYVENASLRLDIRILLAIIPILLFKPSGK